MTTFFIILILTIAIRGIKKGGKEFTDVVRMGADLPAFVIAIVLGILIELITG